MQNLHVFDSTGDGFVFDENLAQVSTYAGSWGFVPYGAAGTDTHLCLRGGSSDTVATITPDGVVTSLFAPRPGDTVRTVYAHEGAFYIVFASGVLGVMDDTLTGLAAEFSFPGNPLGGAPVDVAEGFAFVGSVGDTHKINLSTGSIEWTAPAVGSSVSAVLADGGGGCFIGDRAASVQRVDATGAQIWAIESILGGGASPMAIVQHSDSVFVPLTSTTSSTNRGRVVEVAASSGTVVNDFRPTTAAYVEALLRGALLVTATTTWVRANTLQGDLEASAPAFDSSTIRAMTLAGPTGPVEIERFWTNYINTREVG